jgi:hypothetical protein
MRPIITIHDLETDTIETREMNDAEFEQYQKDQVEKLTKSIDRQAVLNKLGLSDDELAALLG